MTGREQLLTFDMGGTSTDVALIAGEPRLTGEGHIGRFPVAVPMVDMHTIGAGGGRSRGWTAAACCRSGRGCRRGPGPACTAAAQRADRDRCQPGARSPAGRCVSWRDDARCAAARRQQAADPMGTRPSGPRRTSSRSPTSTWRRRCGRSRSSAADPREHAGLSGGPAARSARWPPAGYARGHRAGPRRGAVGARDAGRAARPRFRAPALHRSTASPSPRCRRDSTRCRRPGGAGRRGIRRGRV